MRIAVVTIQVPFVTGGAEVLAEDLTEQLAAHGHEAELVKIPWRWYPNQALYESLLTFRLLDFEHCGGEDVDLVICLKFPAYLIRHPRKVIWLAHQHRMAYELWSHTYGLANSPDGRLAREAILCADQTAIGDCRSVFTISQRVTDRLRTYSEMSSKPLYPPPRNIERYRCDGDEGYLFFPSRLNPLKRQALVLEALAHTRSPIRVVFSGVGDIESYEVELRAMAVDLGVGGRVEWLGRISAEELIQRYAECRAVIFPPFDEDYGYITLEAMLSSKPVITCRDSGGPLEFVLDQETGWITDPDPERVGAAMDRAWEDPDRARRFGEAGRRRYCRFGIGWSRVIAELAGGPGGREAKPSFLQAGPGRSARPTKPTINWISPLPPARTGIAVYTEYLLPYLSEQAEVRLFTFQNHWKETCEGFGPVRSLCGERDLWKLLNVESDLTIAHLGNNALFHGPIWETTRLHPSVVVLHDACLFHFFASLYLDHRKDLQGFLTTLEARYGPDARAAGRDLVAGTRTYDELAAEYPMTDLALERALGAVVHSRSALDHVQELGKAMPIGLLSLPYPSLGEESLEREILCEDRRFRLVVFGHLGRNRRLEALMEALGTMPEKDRFRLEIFGRTWASGIVENMAKSFGLEDVVIFHGWVDEETLERGLRRAHLAVNLRDPTMGEASLSQLQIYSFALPSLVTRRGWYASLDPGTVCFVQPEREIEDIQDALRGLLRDPEAYAEMGRRGLRVLKSEHSPETYAAELIEMAESALQFQARAVSWEIVTSVGTKLGTWETHGRRRVAEPVLSALEELFSGGHVD